MTRIFIAVILSLLFSVSASLSQPLSPKLLSSMKATDPAEKIAVIIELSDQADLRPFVARSQSVRLMSVKQRKDHRSNLIRTLKNKAGLSQKRILRFLRINGIVSPKSLWINNSIAAEISPEVLQLLSVMPGIARIKTDALIYLPVAIPAATGGVEDNLILVKAPDLWALGYQGQGMVVATMDSGADIFHPDLATRWRGVDGLGNSWFDPNGEHPITPTDAAGHGTGVMGVMVGGAAGGTAIGIAPQAKWIAVKIFDDSGTSRNSKVHEGYQWLLDPDNDPATDDAPDVVNNSWGFELNSGTCIETADPGNPGSDFDTDFHPDLIALKAAGIAVVFSAGNTGPLASSDVSPGNYPESFAVGSVDTFSSAISTFSSRGPSSCDATLYPEVVAPGNSVLSADLTFGGTFPNSYALWLGTSFAAPQVAGVMALLTQAFPATPLLDIEDALTASAQDLGALGPDNDYGYGLIDALAAYDWLIQAPNISITDPVPPANDRLLDFGGIEPSVVSRQTIVCSNSGRGELQIATVLLTGDAVFTLLTDGCSNQILTAGQSCDLVVEFSSVTVGTFTGGITVPSNDFDEATLAISLEGIVSNAANPTPRLDIIDSVIPTGDRNIPFGVLLTGSARSESLQVTNDDLGSLILGPLDSSALDGTFTVVADGCSSQTLAFGESCIVGIDFNPVKAGSFSGILSLPSNDPTTPLSQVTVSGAGNNPPPAPSLISPTPGESNLSVPVEFSWEQLPDPDGDKVVNNLYVSTDPSFTAVVPIPIALHDVGRNVLPAAAGGILILSGLLVQTRRKRLMLRMLCLAFALTVLASCSGGGSGSASINPNLRSYTLSNLLSATTYYWKVVADDGNGGISESSVSNFSTK